MSSALFSAPHSAPFAPAGDGPDAPAPSLAGAPAAPGPALPGLTARYECLGLLGRGGAGVVYRMRERATGRELAVKVAEDDAGRAQLAREAELAAALEHPNLLRTWPVDAGGGVAALASPYMAGGSLRAALEAARARAGDATEARPPLGDARAAQILRDVAAGLAHAHAAGVVHGDVKPENVYLDPCSGRAVLGDFGIASRPPRGGRGRATPSVAGTPSYMAPEQVAGAPLDARADVYALGLLGWELLVGRRPWEGLGLADVLHSQRRAPLLSVAALRPDVPAFLLLAVEGALHKSPRARWADARVMLAQLTPTPARLPLPPEPATAEQRELARGATIPLAARVARPGARRTGWATPRRVVVGLAVAGAAGAAFASLTDGHVKRAMLPPITEATVTLPSRAASAAPARVLPASSGVPAAVSARAAAASPAPPPCGTPTVAAQRACVRLRTVAPDARVTAAYDALLAAMQASAGDGWEPAAVRALRVEQQRWAADARRLCPEPGPAVPLADARWGADRAACLAGRAAERVAALRARRARFSPSGEAGPHDGPSNPTRGARRP